MKAKVEKKVGMWGHVLNISSCPQSFSQPTLMHNHNITLWVPNVFGKILLLPYTWLCLRREGVFILLMLNKKKTLGKKKSYDYKKMSVTRLPTYKNHDA